MKRVLSIVLALILCMGMYSMSEAESSQNFDSAVLAVTLAVNSNLEKSGMIDNCKFWLSPIEEPLDPEAPVIVVDTEMMGIAIFGSTYATAWLFQNVEVFNIIKEFCDAPEVTEVFHVIYN